MTKFPKLFAITSIALLISCAKQDQSKNASDTASVGDRPTAQSGPAIKEGEGRGIIRGIGAFGKSVLLDHNDIPGIMDAMAMSYPVERPESMQGLKIGDSVIFTLKEPQVGEYVVSAIAPMEKH